ncbi:hypothetical protein [Parasediminibacterium sp. JCM 36343]|uniref:hypothetical protein n=1 Tax=Parasediminibacterium sp. JCM 36343 TaxID=3374279 RepID=UPI00397E79A7
MSTLELKVYEIFKSKFSEQEAATVIEYFEAKSKEKIDEKTQVYQTLQTKDLENLRKEMHTVFATKEDFAKMDSKLETKLAETKVEILRWMFGIFLAMMMAIIGLYFKK